MSTNTSTNKPKLFLAKIRKNRRNRFKKRNQKRLKNTTPTILCNNCIGGTIYHDLNLPFYSPTINVGMPAEDFLRFVNHLEAFAEVIPEQIFPEGISYPVGVLRSAFGEVRLNWMHDTSFEEAKNKWVRRSRRINYENLYVIFNPWNAWRPSSRWYREFKKIKHPNKHMVTSTFIFWDKEVTPIIGHKFRRKDRILLTYPCQLSKKRYLDRFDYVRFLNQNRAPSAARKGEHHG